MIGAGTERERGYFLHFWDPDDEPRPRFKDWPSGGRAVLFSREEGIAILMMLSETMDVHITIDDPETGMEWTG